MSKKAKKNEKQMVGSYVFCPIYMVATTGDLPLTPEQKKAFFTEVKKLAEQWEGCWGKMWREQIEVMNDSYNGLKKRYIELANANIKAGTCQKKN